MQSNTLTASQTWPTPSPSAVSETPADQPIELSLLPQFIQEILAIVISDIINLVEFSKV